MALIHLTLMPAQVFAFAGTLDTRGCSDWANTPQKLLRHRSETLTFGLTDNFKATYPDPFTQYLVEDVALWWEEYISGYQWTTDIHDAFSYFRKDESTQVYEFKSVMNHEMGHVMGMQHSDACYYNINGATGLPWESNFVSIGGGNAAVQATIGPELMNEIWTYSSPGQKAPKALGIDGYNRTPGLDDFEFMNLTYPFSALALEKDEGTDALIMINSEGAGSGGQGGTDLYSPVDPGDADQGWYIDDSSIWVGTNIGILKRTESWEIENTSGSDINQVTLRVNGTSTRRAIDEWAPRSFTHFGSSITSKPEQQIFGWTAGGRAWGAGSTGNFELELDVHDWSVQEALMWVNSNEVYPIPVISVRSIRPWGLRSPNSPSPAMVPAYAAPGVIANGPSPDEIELLPPTSPPTPGGFRGVQVLAPQMVDLVIERVDLLPLDWQEAEILTRHGQATRRARLADRFATDSAVVTFIWNDPDTGAPLTPTELGFQPLEPSEPVSAGEVSDGDGSSVDRPLLSKVLGIQLSDHQTYALRTTTYNGAAKVTAYTLPEMDTYLGTGTARCLISGDLQSCCPYEMTQPVQPSGTTWSSSALTQSTCVVGKGADESFDLQGAVPHLVATGGGNDSVYSQTMDSIVLLGEGDDLYTAGVSAGGQARGGAGGDKLKGSDEADELHGDAGDDTLFGKGGNDLIFGGAGKDFVDAGSGNDEIYPGSGGGDVYAGDGDDQVIFLNACELESGGYLEGGPGRDVLVLPGTEQEARAQGLRISGFETIVENSARASKFADCR